MNQSRENTKQTKITKQTELLNRFRLFRYFRLFRILLACLFIFPSASISAQTKQFGDISVRVESIASSVEYGYGYEEYRATIVNLSSQRAHQVTLVASASGSGMNNNVFRRTVEVAAYSTSQISLFRPQSYPSGIDLAVIIDGERQKDAVPAEATRTGAWVQRANNRLTLLISQRVSRSKLMSEAAVEEGLKEATEIDVAYLPYDVPLNEWSANWLGYTQFDGIVLTSDDLREMPSGVHSALWSYVECGGSLLVIGSWEAPQQWEGRQHSIISASDRRNDLPFYYIGFGTLIPTGNVDPKQIDADQWTDIKNHWKGSRTEKLFPRAYFTQLAEINKEFPVIDRIGVPVRGFFILMIVFVIVIGPLNLIWLSRRRKKIWLLWTVPAISLVTTLAVSSFAFLSEGLSATARMEAMTILDEVSHRATSIGWIGFYSPVTPSEGLHFSYDTELSPKIYWDYKYGEGPIRTIDWTHDQHLASEWITARVPVYFTFRKSESRRERLTVREGENGSISLVNGLGADIRQLWWADKTGELYTATNIPAGAESQLTPINLKASGAANRLRDVYIKNWLEMFNTMEVNPREALAAGCYLAVLDASPFVEEGLRDVKTRKVKTLVYGIQDSGQ
jgi:hypothetical protein